MLGAVLGVKTTLGLIFLLSIFACFFIFVFFFNFFPCFSFFSLFVFLFSIFFIYFPFVFLIKKKFLPFSFCFSFFFLGCPKTVAALQDSLWKSGHSGNDQVESRLWWAAGGSSPTFVPESPDKCPR